MGDFSAEWLSLREPFDHGARATSLTLGLLNAIAANPAILDLACGTGSNFRYLSRQPSLSAADWLLVDHDRALLERVPFLSNVTVFRHDLRTLDDRLFRGRALVTASALLDLVSERWLHDLASHCRTQGAAVLFALSYDGRTICEPADPDDAAIRDLVNRHQRTDKGFGTALGPDATACAVEVFGGVGYQVTTSASDWVLAGTSSTDLQRQLVDGWAAAAVEMVPDRSAAIEAWRARRQAHVAAGRSMLTVGHQDLAAVMRSA
jgi:hypothetical protein